MKYYAPGITFALGAGVAVAAAAVGSPVLSFVVIVCAAVIAMFTLMTVYDK